MTSTNLKSQHDPRYAGRDGAAAAANKPVKPTTIFRGGHRRAYTNLPNSTINDPNLGLDEVGALARLLSLPTNWQMHPFEIRKRWGVGREKYYRILERLIQAGYVIAGEMIRGEGGEFTAKEYLVFDTPQVNAGDPVDVPDDDLPYSRPEEGGGSAEPAPPPATATVASLPQPGFPHTADPDAVEQDDGERIYNNNPPPTPPGPEPPSAETADPGGFKAAVPLPDVAPAVAGQGSGTPTKARGDFGAPRPPGAPLEGCEEFARRGPSVEEFLDAWRRAGGACMSPDRVRRAWVKRRDDARRDAVARISDFIADRRRRGWKICDAASYVRDALWEAFAAKPTIFELSPSMPEWHRWRDYYIAQNKPFMVRQMDAMARQNKTFPAQRRWPPGNTSTDESGGDGDAA